MAKQIPRPVLEFDDFQIHAIRTKTFPVLSPELTRHYLLAGVTAQLGELANRLKKRLRDRADYVKYCAKISYADSRDAGAWTGADFWRQEEPAQQVSN